MIHSYTKEQLRESGVYQILCTANGKSYIGSAVRIGYRKNRHLHHLLNENHFSKNLQNSFNKYGYNKFEFLILEFCAHEELLQREQYFIDLINPEFNSRKIAKSNIGCKMSDIAKDKARQTKIKNGFYEKLRDIMRERSKGNKNMLGKKHSAETKRKISEKSKGRKASVETISKMRAASTGRKHTNETKNKMSRSAMGNKKGLGRVVSEEHKERLRNLRSIEIKQYSISGDFIRIWASSKLASKETGVSQGNINSCCNGKRKNAGGFIWVK